MQKKDDSRTRQRQLREKPHFGEEGTVSGGGRGGGKIPRKVGTRDEEKRATERPAGTSRVRKKDKEEG